jgi:prophage tail gpP-like protein
LFLNLNNINSVHALICFLFLHSNGIDNIPFIELQTITFTEDIFSFSTFFYANLGNVFYGAFVPANPTLKTNKKNKNKKKTNKKKQTKTKKNKQKKQTKKK